MHPVAAHFEAQHQVCFKGQPFFPAFSYFVFVYISLRQIDEEAVMTGFTFHEAAIEIAEVFVVEALAKSFETLAAAGFDEGEDE